MIEDKKISEDGEVNDEQLEDVAGGVLPNINVKIGTDGESKDEDHDNWIEIVKEDPPPKNG